MMYQTFEKNSTRAYPILWQNNPMLSFLQVNRLHSAASDTLNGIGKGARDNNICLPSQCQNANM